MFFAENCQVRRSHLVDFEKQLSPILVGRKHVSSSKISIVPDLSTEAGDTVLRSTHFCRSVSEIL